MEFTEEISKRIYDIIKDNDTNQKELAKAIDVNPKQISRWKTGQAEMRIYKLREQNITFYPTPPGGEVIRGLCASRSFTENRYRDKRGGLTAPR